MAKPSKSVERDKVKRKSTKSPQNENNNTNITQIIFPSDMEIRQKRKPRRKPRNNQRKKLLEELKSKLETYDNIQDEVRKKNITIPEKLGLSTVSPSELKTNDDIKTFIQDIDAKTQGLQQLLQGSAPLGQGASMQPQPFVGLQQPSMFNVAYRQGLPMHLPNMQMSTPQQQPEPSSSASTPPFQSVTLHGQQNTASSPPSAPVDQVGAQLQQIASEVSNQLQSTGQTPPPPPPQPSLPPPGNQTGSYTPSGVVIATPNQVFDPPPPADPSQMQVNRGVNIDGKNVDLTAPRGWYELYHRYQKYVKDVEFNKLPSSPGIYHITLRDFKALDSERRTIDSMYTDYMSKLSPSDLNYITTDPFISTYHDQIMVGLQEEPKTMLASILRDKGTLVTEVTQGNELSSMERSAEQQGFKDEEQQKINEKYETQYASDTAELAGIRTAIQKATNQDSIDRQLRQLNKLSTRINKEFEQLGDMRQFFRTRYEKLNNRVQQTRTLAAQGVTSRAYTAEQMSDAKKQIQKYLDTATAKYTDKIRKAVYILFDREQANIIDAQTSVKLKRSLLTQALQQSNI